MQIKASSTRSSKGSIQIEKSSDRLQLEFSGSVLDLWIKT